MMRSVATLSISALVLAMPAAAGESFFMGLGALPGRTFHSDASDLSADGLAAAGRSPAPGGGFTSEAWHWSKAGLTGLGDLPGGTFDSRPGGISPDGRYIVGGSSSVNGYEAFLWSEKAGMIGLGDLPGGAFYSDAADVSSDGQVVVGESRTADGYRAFRWTAQTGMQEIPGMRAATALSADGAVIATNAGGRVYRWTEQGATEIGGSWAIGMSDNGRNIVGFTLHDHGREAFLWSEGEGIIGLGYLPGADFLLSSAYGVSDNGRTVVGVSSGPPHGGDTAFIWQEGVGMHSVQEVLLGLGIDVQAMGWDRLGTATAVSMDGRTILGTGYGPNGPEAWIAHIPAPAAAAALALGLAANRPRRRRG